MLWWKNPKYKDKTAIIANGSVRAGKTISMSIGFMLWSMDSFDHQSFAICGKTIQSLRRNVIRFLPHWLGGTGIVIREKRNENYFTVTYGGKENRYYLFGGKDEASASLIQGMTLAGVLFDEVALMPRSFVEQALARCSVDGSKFWFNCNPDNPGHWFYIHWMKQLKKRNALYLHFTMDDNLSLSEEIKDRYKSLYSGLFYKRFILGQWVAASGAVYDMFDKDTMVGIRNPEDYDRHYVAIDYGNANATVFGFIHAAGKGENLRHYIEREYYHDGRKKGLKTTEQYSADLKSFIGERKIDGVIVDPSALAFIAQLQHDGFKVIRGRNSVLQGISRCAVEFQQGNLIINPACVNGIRETSGYIWDEKAQSRGEDAVVQKDDHFPDMFRYGVYTDYRMHKGDRKNYSR